MKVWLGVAAAGAALLAAGVVAGERTEYQIDAAGPGTLEAGTKGVVTLTITPLRGRRISRDGPLSIDVLVDPPDGLAVARTRMRLRDAVDPQAQAPRFEIPVEAAKPGRYRLEIDVRFWICAKRTCRPVRERRTVAIEVSEPPPPPPPADAGPGPDGPGPGPPN